MKTFVSTIAMTTALCWASATPLQAQAIPVPAQITEFKSPDQILAKYAELTSRTVLRPAALPAASVTISTYTPLSREEEIQALDHALAVNGVTIIPQGEKFAKAVPSPEAIQEQAASARLAPAELPDAEHLVTHVAQLETIKPSEAAQAVVALSKNPAGIVPYDSNQTLVLRDSPAKIKEMVGLIEELDGRLAQATPPAAVYAPGAPSLATRLDRIVRRGPSKTLVIRSGAMDSTEQANLEEDLAVMARVLERALEQKLDEDDGPRASASGINVFFKPDGGAMRSVYLEGYGALFTLNVRLPLLAPATRSEEEKPKPQSDSSWEQAQRELYGRPDDGAFEDVFHLNTGGREPQEYDADKVETLKQALLSALKSASNIRNLKPDESITLCVFGGATVQPDRGSRETRTVQPDRSPREVRVERDNRMRKKSDDKEKTVVVDAVGDRVGGPRGTVMTLRVKKGDVDAFAKGKLELDEFAKKAAITSYAASGGGWGGGGGFSFGR